MIDNANGKFFKSFESVVFCHAVINQVCAARFCLVTTSPNMNAHQDLKLTL